MKLSAADVYGLAHVIKCITVKVQKCVYCAREGDTIVSIASQVCCGVSQCVAVCCSVLQCVAVCGSVWQ